MTTRAKPKPATTTWRVRIDGWLPTSLNKLVGNRWRASRLKKTDARTIAQACLLQRVSPVALSTGEKKARKALGVPERVPSDPTPRKRHVRLEIKLGKGQRSPDPDNLWKGLLDGLKHAGMLVDDNRQWCSHDAEITFTRGDTEFDRGTVIILENIG